MSDNSYIPKINTSNPDPSITKIARLRHRYAIFLTIIPDVLLNVMYYNSITAIVDFTKKHHKALCFKALLLQNISDSLKTTALLCAQTI